jgi:HSP20 family protein
MARRAIEELFWQGGNDLGRLTEEIGMGRPKVANARFWEPRVDVFEEGHRFVLRAELAGVRGEDIQLLYIAERHAIVIRGIRQDGELTNTDGVVTHQLEIYYGEFQREIPLPESTIDVSAIRAQYRNGFLLVMVPKLERAVVRRIVQITSH